MCIIYVVRVIGFFFGKMVKIVFDVFLVWIVFKSWGFGLLFYFFVRNLVIFCFFVFDKEIFEVFVKVFVENEIYVGIDSIVGMGWYKKWKC